MNRTGLHGTQQSRKETMNRCPVTNGLKTGGEPRKAFNRVGKIKLQIIKIYCL
ncbi:MAG: hypothetical protein LBR10_05770 [Prevotellaceae bacterium]|jgi:hypothetical protein|nr:hypothetical protein [Prevotellaceae bacterium]